MELFNFEKHSFQMRSKFPLHWFEKEQFFVICTPEDMHGLQADFHFDESTIAMCTDLDESIRCRSFDGYDFISLVYLHARESTPPPSNEINFYLSKQYIVMVVPSKPDAPMTRFCDFVREAVWNASRSTPSEKRLSHLFCRIIEELLTEFSSMLEQLEDDLQSLESQILQRSAHVQPVDISGYREITYRIMKQLRALTYVGDSLLVNYNDFMPEKNVSSCLYINTRMRKLYDLSAQIHDYCNSLMQLHETKLAAQTAETVNKLTIITIFFGPLTVITGIYGMNFTHMPELSWRVGYPLTLLLMLLITAAIYLFLKKRKWL